MIAVTGKLTFDDYFCAQRNHAYKRNLAMALILATGFLVTTVQQDYMLSGFFFAYLAIRPFYMRMRSKRFWQQTPSYHKGQKTLQLNEIGFHAEDDEGQPFITHWDKFLKWRESEDTFFLYLSPHLFVFLPKRFIETEQQDRIRQLLKDKIKQGSQNI